jgi:hypothetical protein
MGGLADELMWRYAVILIRQFGGEESLCLMLTRGTRARAGELHEKHISFSHVFYLWFIFKNLINL